MDLLAVCDQCKVKVTFGGPKIPGWGGIARAFFQRHVGHNFTGCRVVNENNPCPNRARHYEEETVD